MATHAKKATGKPRRKPKKVERKWWTDNERYAILATLDANGGNVALTAKETDCPYHTLYAWSRGSRYPEALQLHTEKRGDLASACEELAWTFAAIIPEKIDAAPLGQMMTGFGILVDKMRLLRNEPTNYNLNQNDNTNRSVVMDKLVELLTDDQRARLREIIEGLDSGGDGRSMAGLPETSGVPVSERELQAGQSGRECTSGDGQVEPEGTGSVLQCNTASAN